MWQTTDCSGRHFTPSLNRPVRLPKIGENIGVTYAITHYALVTRMDDDQFSIPLTLALA